jgi:WD40 repeat protein
MHSLNVDTKVIIIILITLILFVKSSTNMEEHLTFLSINNNKAQKVKSIDFQLVNSIQAHFSFMELIYPLKSQRFVTLSKDSTLKEWNPSDNFKNTHTIFTKERSWFTSAVELDMGHLVVAGLKRIIVYDTFNNYKIIKKIEAHSRLIQSLLVLNRNSRNFLISSSDDGDIKIWDINNDYSLVKSINAHSGSAHEVLEMSNGMLVSASYDKTIKFWKFSENFEEFELINTVHDMAFTIAEIDGNLAYGSNSSKDFDVIVMDVKDFSIKGRFKGHNLGVVVMRMLSSGYLVTVARDGVIRIWDVDSYEEVNRLSIQHSQGINTLVELSDGSLVTGVYGELQVWALERRDYYEK